MPAARVVDTTLILLRTMPYTQEVDVTNQGAFHAETIEKGYDALAMQIQQLDDSTLQLIFDGGEFVWSRAAPTRLIRCPRAPHTHSPPATLSCRRAAPGRGMCTARPASQRADVSPR